jgi:transcription elongation GreA/GreB family factor
MDKRDIFTQIKAALEERRSDADGMRRREQEEANRHIGRMASRYDTFKEEAQMMAGQHEQRAGEIAAEIRNIELLLEDNKAMDPTDSVRAGTVVLVKNGASTQRYVLSPAGGGTKLKIEDEELMVITPLTPLGRQLLGLIVGDEFTLRTGRELKQYEVVEIQ